MQAGSVLINIGNDQTGGACQSTRFLQTHFPDSLPVFRFRPLYSSRGHSMPFLIAAQNRLDQTGLAAAVLAVKKHPLPAPQFESQSSEYFIVTVSDPIIPGIDQHFLMMLHRHQF